MIKRIKLVFLYLVINITKKFIIPNIEREIGKLETKLVNKKREYKDFLELTKNRCNKYIYDCHHLK